MKLNSNQQAFLELVKAGLWEKDACLKPYGDIDIQEVYRLSHEQSVVGLVAAGLEHVQDVKVPQMLVLQLVGHTLQIEQRNKAMNSFIGNTVDGMREKGIYTLLVKGQGIGQCYERPLWRSSGDVDFFLSNDNYEKAKQYLIPSSSGNKPERLYSKEMWLSIDSWYVEVHGTLRTGLSGRVDKVVDEVQKDLFYGGNVRSWDNGGTTVFLPAPDNDVFFVFTHFIKHFYKEGMNLRQICDWCRLLWTYKDSLNHKRLEFWIRKAGLMKEWKAFASIALDYMGMPKDAMPFYNDDVKWKKKAEKILDFILQGGEWRKVKDTITVGKIFPMSTLRFLPGIILNVNWLKIKERLFKA